MTHIAKILVPVDLSPRSIEAARYAAFLRLQFGSELVFLHALQDGWPLRAKRKEMRDRIMNLPGAAYRFLVREGAPAATILRTVQARPKTALSRMLDGSITARALRGARCPVWAGLGDDGPPFGKPIRTILCALSLGPRASAVLRWSAGLAARLKPSRSVIHASKGLASLRLRRHPDDSGRRRHQCRGLAGSRPPAGRDSSPGGPPPCRPAGDRE
jgi:hypothetical protein